MTATVLAEQLAKQGVRPTAQRLAVYSYLLAHPTHPTADTIYEAVREQYPSFSRTTVYNALHALTEAGLCRLVGIQPEEQRFDGDAADHGHIRCRGCGQIWDAPMNACAADMPLPEGFRVWQRDVFLTGLCRECAQKQENAQDACVDTQ